ANGNLAKNSVGDGNGSDEELALLIDPGSGKSWFVEACRPRRKRNFLPQFTEGRFTQADPTYVVVKAHLFRPRSGTRAVIIIVIAFASYLNRIHLEDSGIGCDFLADLLAAG